MSMAEPFVPRSADNTGDEQMDVAGGPPLDEDAAATEQAHFDDVLRRQRGTAPLFPIPDPAVTRADPPTEPAA